MTGHTPGAILVGVDDSLNASIAAAWAISIGRRLGAPIRAVAAYPESAAPTVADSGDQICEMNASAVDLATKFLHGAGLDGIDLTTARGPIAVALLAAAKESEASMLVVGTRGLGLLSGLLLGSVSRRLLFTADRPLVLVPRRSTLNPPPLARVLVGVDCSPVAQRVLSWAARFCVDLGVPATIVRCADPGCEKPPGHVERFDDRVRADAEKALQVFRDHGVAYTVVVSRCDPRVAILETAASDQAGLIVIGTRGAGQFSGLGGTASYLARHSPLPLAVIP